ncbi:hypothetical protein DY000_02052267 [Brassica cretica]|uniref:Uncharacterized protein n=1 Tax=Brassica cretica TaxID=69181 RepID=A0ABQ7A5H2_BRACR|nr:hypothetical protein DY000_02052267 [Brassica cretica]
MCGLTGIHSDGNGYWLSVYWKAKETDGNGYPRRLLSSSGTVTRMVTEQLLDVTERLINCREVKLNRPRAVTDEIEHGIS